MNDANLRDLGLILTAAFAMALVGRRLRLPPIVTYMLAGLVLGPATGIVHATASLELVSEMGIALLLFLVGLELSLQRVKDIGRMAVSAGGAQLLATTAAAWVVAVALGARGVGAALIAIGVSISSTVVVVKALEQSGEMDTLHGRVAVGILLAQDIAVAVVLTLLAGLGSSGQLGLASVGAGVGRAFVGMAALVALAVVAVRWVLPRLLEWLGASLEALFIWSLTGCFAFILAAERLGLSVEIGAFVAGVALAQLAYAHEMVRRVHPLANFFLAVFFVTLGIHLELAEAMRAWPMVLALTLFVLVAKPAILLVILRRLRLPPRAAFLASLSLGQASEFCFILAALALRAHLIDESFPSIFGAVGLISIGVSAALIQKGDALYAWARRLGLFRGVAEDEDDGRTGAVAPRDHIVVIGMNSLGRRIVRDFAAAGERVIAIDTDAAKLEGLPAELLQGSADHAAVLDAANIGAARLVVSALQIEDANNLIAWRARESGVACSIHAFDPAMIDDLRAHGATHVMVSKYDGIRRVAAELRGAGVIGR